MMKTFLIVSLFIGLWTGISGWAQSFPNENMPEDSSKTRRFKLKPPPINQTGKPLHWHPDSIRWQVEYPNGTKYALLEGNRNQPGKAFTYAFFIPAGFWDEAHSHSSDARVVVVKGRLQLGYGNRIVKEQAQTFEVGSYLFVPANANHFDGSDVNTIIIGTAIGPWTTTYLK